MAIIHRWISEMGIFQQQSPFASDAIFCSPRALEVSEWIGSKVRNDRLRLRGYAGCCFVRLCKPRQFVFGDGKPRSSTIQANQNLRERQNAGIVETLEAAEVDVNFGRKLRLIARQTR
jgi:hypothetical protein